MKNILLWIFVGHILLGIIFISSDAPKYIPKLKRSYTRTVSSENVNSKKAVKGKSTSAKSYGNTSKTTAKKTISKPKKVAKPKVVAKANLEIPSLSEGMLLWINGKKQKTSGLLEFPAGKYTLSTWKKGFKVQNQVLSLKSGQTQKWNIPTLSSHQSFKENIATLNLSMCAIEGGVFTMGDNRGKDSPRHQVVLDAFYASEQYITYHDYVVFLNDAKVPYNNSRAGIGDKNYIKVNGGSSIPLKYKYGKYSLQNERWNNKTVQSVTWYGAKAFCDWLSQKTGKKYRLLTEAEWEFAAGGNGNASRYIKGDGFKLQKEWCYDTYSQNFYKQSTKTGFALNPCNLKGENSKVIRGENSYRERKESRPSRRAATFRVACEL